VSDYDFASRIAMLDPNVSPMFGHKHRTRREKLRDWLDRLNELLAELPEVFIKDPPDQPGLISVMRNSKDPFDWVDE